MSNNVIMITLLICFVAGTLQAIAINKWFPETKSMTRILLGFMLGTMISLISRLLNGV